MALCCIGGVCIPYSALMPVLFIALRWIAGKLHELGLIPKAWLPSSDTKASTSSCCSADSSCTTNTRRGKKSSATSTKSCNASTGKVLVVESAQQWQQLSTTSTLVIVKFTATWCGPCKKIAPLYSDLAATHKGALFVEVDVDDLDEVASQHSVAMMPTFVVLRDGKEVDRMTGSKDAQLQSLVEKHASTVQ